jgi:ribosome modulation factor
MKNGVLTMPLEPWNQGYKAGFMGWAACPYPALSNDGWAWSAGYIEGRAAHAKSTT